MSPLFRIAASAIALLTISSAEPAAGTEAPAEAEKGRVELKLSGGPFGEETVLKVDLINSMTRTAFGNMGHEMTGQGLVDVPGKGEVLFDLGLFLPPGKTPAVGEYDAAPLTLPDLPAAKPMATLGLGIREEDTFKAAFAGTKGSFTITEVGPRFRGKVKGKCELTLKDDEGTEIRISGTFSFVHFQ